MRPGRQALLADALPRYAVELPADGGPLDPARLFAGPVADVWLEIGFGYGEHLVGQALARPDVGLIGCESYADGVAALLKQVEEHRLQHVRIFAGDARELLDALPDESLGRVFVLFSDPWPKRRHHRRRFMQEATVARLAEVLRPGGELQFATDHMGYLRWTLALLIDHPAFRWCARSASDWRMPPPGWIATRYQQKAQGRGASCVYLRFLRQQQR